jgi:hypothetical protein
MQRTHPFSASPENSCKRAEPVDGIERARSRGLQLKIVVSSVRTRVPLLEKALRIAKYRKSSGGTVGVRCQERANNPLTKRLFEGVCGGVLHTAYSADVDGGVRE